jgi:hypothetical protein
MRIRASVAFIVLMGAGTLVASQAPAQSAKPAAKAAASKPGLPAANEVLVTVSYTGKGAVDPAHEILVFLFADPNINSGSRPLGPPQIDTKNGGVASFKDVTTPTVYVIAIYDEKSIYDGSTPPPAGIPYEFFGATAAKPAAAGVVPGPKGAVTIKIDGSKKWKG